MNGISAFATNHRTRCVAFSPRAHMPSIQVVTWPKKEVKAVLTGGTDLEYVDLAFARDGERVIGISAATDHTLFVSVVRLISLRVSWLPPLSWVRPWSAEASSAETI